MGARIRSERTIPINNAQADGELLKFWDRGRVRGGAIFRSDSNVIWVVQSSCKKYIAFAVGQISSTSLRRPNPARGADRDRHERGMGCGGRDGVGAQGDRRAGPTAREQSRRAGRTALFAYGKTVWSRHPLLVPSCRWLIRSDRIGQPQAGSDGDKTNSSPGRARHKP